MKTYTTNQQTLLDSGDYAGWKICIKLKRTDDTILGFTESDITQARDIGDGDGSTDYKPGFLRTGIDADKDLSGGSVDMKGILGTIAQNRVNPTEVRAGLFDYAEFTMFYIDIDTPSDTPLFIKSGFLGEVETQDSDIWLFEGVGRANNLTQPFLEVTQPECRYDTFDSRCGLDPAAFTDTGTVTSVSLARSSFAATMSGSRENGYFTLGLLTWSGGNNSGLGPLSNIEVKTHTELGSPAEATFLLYLKVPFNIEVGDTFSVQAGDDKKPETCKDRFSNLVNFGGEAGVGYGIPGRDQIQKAPDAP